MLYRPNPKPKEGEMKLDQNLHRIFKIAKNKEGPRGTWPLSFDGPKQTFSTVVRDDGKAVLRQMVDAGKAAKQKPRQQAFGGDGSDWLQMPDGEQTPFDEPPKEDKKP